MSTRPKNTGRFGKGNPGKPKGATNKTSRDLREMILGALSDVGGQEYLVLCAIADPKAFLALLGRVLPMQLTGTDGRSLAEELGSIPRVSNDG